jgi:hypothetical protein
MSQQVSRLMYDWEFKKFWVERKIIRLEEKTERQNETNVSEVIMDSYDVKYVILVCLTMSGI